MTIGNQGIVNPQPSALDNFNPHREPTFVFVKPQMGENLGSAARAMLNFGLRTMYLVSPDEDWLSPGAVALASGAGSVLANAGMFTDIGAAMSKFQAVYATTARGRGLWKPILSPREAMVDARSKIDKGNRVAFLFGPERTGLTNSDLEYANAIVTVPANPAFSSMNLAHCALLLAYEWGLTDLDSGDSQIPDESACLATVSSKEALVTHYVADLDNTDYFRPKDRRQSMVAYLRNFLFRLDLTDAEVKTLHRVRKSLKGRSDNQGS